MKEPVINELLLNFPIKVRDDIGSISSNAGVLKAEQCVRICQQLSLDLDNLMTQLLPIAASFSNPTISDYRVGAVARGVAKDSSGMPNLYLGANFEFSGQALCYSVHAEQSALSNAWLNGEPRLEAIAVTAPPCGHCRQFLYEMTGDRTFPIILPSVSADKTAKPVDLSDLLPSAFGPLDLGSDRLLMEASFGSNGLSLLDNNDELINGALQAADLSYAPYTSNFAGCAIKLSDGKIFTGRYAENAAHNPSLSPFSSAFSSMMLGSGSVDNIEIVRVVLVENPTKSSQKNVCQDQLLACRQAVELEYVTASMKYQ